MCRLCSDTSVSGIHPCMHGLNDRKTSVVFFYAYMHERKLSPMQRDMLQTCMHIACRLRHAEQMLAHVQCTADLEKNQ